MIRKTFKPSSHNNTCCSIGTIFTLVVADARLFRRLFSKRFKRKCLFLDAFFGRCVTLVGTFLYTGKCKRLCIDQQNGCFVPFARKCCAAIARLKLYRRTCSGFFGSIWQRMQTSFGQKVLKKSCYRIFSKSISTRS